MKIYTKNTVNSKGFSLLILLVILFAFIAAYPAIFSKVENGHRLSVAFFRWSQLQRTGDNILHLKYRGCEVPPSHMFSLGNVSSFGVSIQVEKNSNQISATFTPVIDSGGIISPTGFDNYAIIATFSATSANYASWTRKIN
ncbi:MAG: hypothetical protein HQM10_21095 [Candidatus Riflebacteria bacterium]|nr:hypothetical protein [Candidatus Riflebacteria bacterium]